MNTSKLLASLLFSTAVMQANEVGTIPEASHLTKTQKQIQQYVTETLLDLGVASEHSTALDPRETLGVSNKTSKSWSILNLLETNMTGNTANDHAIHLFGDRMNAIRSERRRQVNHLITALNEVYYRILVNQSVVRTLGIRLIDFFNDSLQGIDCDEKFQQNAKHFLDVVNKTFHSPAFKLPFEAKDLRDRNLLYYFPNYEPDNGEGTSQCDDCDFLSPHLDLNGHALTLTGTYQVQSLCSRETEYQLLETMIVHCLRNGDQERIFTGMISDTGNAGTLAVTGGSHVLNTEAGSSVQNLNLTGGVLTLGQDGNGHLNASNVQVASGVLALGRNSTEAAIATFALDAADEVTTQEISSHGSLTVRDQLEIGEGGVLKVGGEGAIGDVTVTGTTTHNGRVEIYKTKDGSPAKFGAYTGTGNTYISEGSTMEVAFDTGPGANYLEYSGNFEGEGNLVLSGIRNYWKNMGSGTLGSLTVNGTSTCWNQASGKDPIEIKGEMRLKTHFQIGQEAPCSITCDSLTTEGNGYFYLCGRGSQLICHGEIVQHSRVSSHVYSGGALTTKSYSLNQSKLYIGHFLAGTGTVTVQETMSTASGTEVLFGENGNTDRSGKLTVGGILTHNGTIDVYRLTDENSLIFGGLEGEGTINLNDTTNPMTINFTRDCTFTGQITGSGIINLHSTTPVTFSWPQRSGFTGTVNKDDTVTILSSAELDLNGHILTLTGNGDHEEFLLLPGTPVVLDHASKTVQTLTSKKGQAIYEGVLLDTGNAGTLAITGGIHTLLTTEGSSVHTLNVDSDGTLHLGNNSTVGTLVVSGSTDAKGSLNIASQGTLSLNGANSIITGTTTNNGRVEIVKTADGSPAKFGEYQGSGNTYIAPGATMEVAFDMGTENFLEYSGNFEGEGNLVLSGAHNNWKNMGGGTLNSLTVNGYTQWGQAAGAKPITIFEDAIFNEFFGNYSTTAFSLTCNSARILKRHIDIIGNATFTCNEGFYQNSTGRSCVFYGGVLITKNLVLNRGEFCNGYDGTGTVTVQETMLTASGALFRLGLEGYKDRSGKLTVGGILTHNGTMNVHMLTDENSLVLGGLEGAGTINFYDTNTQPMTISPATDCAFLGTISGTGIVNINGSADQALDLQPESSIQTLNVKSGTAAVGNTQAGALAIPGALNVDAGGVFKVGSEEATGMVTVTGTTTNNGRVEIVKTADGSPAKFGEYQGSGNTYIAPGATMEVAFDTGAAAKALKYSGNFEGEGNLVLSGGNNKWNNMDSGTLGSLTVNGYSILGQASGAQPIKVKGEVRLNDYLRVGFLSSSSCSITCEALTIEEKGCFCVPIPDSQLICHGEIVQNSRTTSQVYSGGSLTTKSYTLNRACLCIGWDSAGTGTVIVHDTISTANGTKVYLGNSSPDYCGTLTVGGVLTHNGTIDVYRLTDENSLVLGGLEGAGTINFYDTNTQPMTISPTTDCAFLGTITGPGEVNIAGTATQAFDAEDGLTIQTLNVKSGTAAVGNTQAGQLTIPGTLNVDAGGIFKVGSTSYAGTVEVTGTTTNKGRIEILNTPDGSPAKFGEYQGSGNTYIAPGATMEVAFDSTLSYSGNFEGEGHLVLSGAHNDWKNMGSGTLGSLTVNGYSRWGQAFGKEPIEIKGEVRVNAYLGVGSNDLSSACSITCNSLTTEGNGYFFVYRQSSQLTCLGEIVQNSSNYTNVSGGALTTKIYTLNRSSLCMGWITSGTGTVTVQDTMSTASGTAVYFGQNGNPDSSGKLTVGRVLTHNGTMNVYRLTDANSLVFGGLEGAGTITFYSTNTQPMTISPTTDCAFLGTITGPGEVNIAGTATQAFDAEDGLTIQTLNVKGGTAAVGNTQAGQLTIPGTLNIDANGIFKVGSESATGTVTVTGTTTNNGRVEIVKTADGSPAKFGAYQGSGNTYIASGATMEVAFDTGSYDKYLEYSGDFEGEGNLILSGANNNWQKMGSGTLGSLTVNGQNTHWSQSSGSKPIEIKGEIRLNSYLEIGSLSPCSITCHSLTTEGNGRFYVFKQGSQLTCSGEIIQNSNYKADICSGGTLTTKNYTLNKSSLYIGYSSPSTGTVIVQETMLTASETNVYLGANGHTDRSGKLTVGGVLTHNGTMNVYRLTDSESLMFGGLTGTGTINLHDTTNPITINFTRDCTFTGPITGSGIINLRSETPVTFTWPQRWTFEGTVNKDDTVTIVCPAEIDVSSQILTLTGVETDALLVANVDTRLSAAKTARTIADTTLYRLSDTGAAGTLAITGGTHTFTTANGSNVHTLTVEEGTTFTLGSESTQGSLTLSGTVDIQGALDIAENGTLKLNGATSIITGPTANNGRVEILNTPDGAPAKFGEYTGAGNTYIAPGATMEVAFDTGSDAEFLEYSGNFEGEGNLVLSGTHNNWKNMGSGTLGSLTVNGRTFWTSPTGSDKIIVKGTVILNNFLGLSRPILCDSLIVQKTYFCTSAQITCLGSFIHNSQTNNNSICCGGSLSAKTCALNYFGLKIGNVDGFVLPIDGANSGTVTIQETMFIGDTAGVVLGLSGETNYSGKLTVGGILTHNGTMNVYHLTDSESLMFGGLEGTGTINLQDTTNPMTIHFTQDCTFTGKITGPGTVNLHSETPVTFTWPQRLAFTGTLNKDDTVTIVYQNAFDFFGNTLTLTGQTSDAEYLVTNAGITQLSGNTTARTLTTTTGQAVYDRYIMDTPNNGTLSITGGTHTFLTTAGSTVNTLNVAEGSVFQVGNASVPGSFEITGTTTNNGRVEIHKTADGSPAKFGAYTGAGNTYIAPGATMEVAFNSTLDYPGNFEGEGHLVLSGANNTWENMGGGTLGSLTVHGRTHWKQASGSKPIEIKGEVILNGYLGVGPSSPCSVVCGSLTTKGSGYFDIFSSLSCRGIIEHSTGCYVYTGGILSTSRYSLKGVLRIGASATGTGSVFVQEIMLTENSTEIEIGRNGYTDRSGKLTVSGVLTHNGTMNVCKLTDSESLMFGGLEGEGTIQFYDSNTQPMIISPTTDCAFLGQITGAGTVNIAGSAIQAFDNPNGSTLQILNIRSGTAAIGETRANQLAIPGTLNVDAGGVFKVGSESATGTVNVTGTTTNNGRVEIHKTADGSPAKFGAYTGTGNTYIAPGATMEVAFDTGSDAEFLVYSGNFEGEGNLVLSGTHNNWKNMGSGTFGSLTVNGNTYWEQSSGTDPIEIKGPVILSACLGIGSLSPCSITCHSLTTEGNGRFYVFKQGSQLTCSGEIIQNSNYQAHVCSGGTLTTKSYTLNKSNFGIGYPHEGTGTVTVQEFMLTASKTHVHLGVYLGLEYYSACSGTLTVGGILTHNGAMNVWRLTDENSLMFGGLEGEGTINLNDTTNPMTISPTTDCAFLGQITGPGEVNIAGTATQAFDAEDGLTIQTLNVRSGTAAIGETRASQLAIPGTLNVDAGGVFKVGSESATGTVTVTGPTTNNGRVEIHKTADGSPAKFGEYQGSGNTYIAPGATMEVAFDTGSDAEFLVYSGNFEGEGNLVLSGTHNNWKNMGSGTLGSLTVSGSTIWNQAAGADSIEIKGEVKLNTFLCIGSLSPCSITCHSLTTEGNGYFYVWQQGSQLTCLGEIVQNTTDGPYVSSGGALTTKSYTLNESYFWIGHPGTGTVTVQESMLTASETEVYLGAETYTYTDSSGKLTVGGVLTHNGTIEVHRLIDENSFVLGGLEGTGTIQFYDSNTQPMTINFTRDCTFTGKITGAATLNLHSATPVTFAWSQRSAFKGTVNKDDTVTILEALVVDGGDSYTLEESKTVLYIASHPVWGTTLNLQDNKLTIVGIKGETPTFFGILGNEGNLTLAGNQQNLDTDEGSSLWSLTVSSGILTIGSSQNGYLYSNNFYVEPEGVVVLGSDGGVGEGHLIIGTHVSIDGQVKILKGTLTTQPYGDADSYFSGSGTIYVGEQSTFAFHLYYMDVTFDGQITGSGTVSLTSEGLVTFTWPQRSAFKGTVYKDDKVTIKTA